MTAKLDQDVNKLPPLIHYVGDPQSDPYFTAGNVRFFNVNQTLSGHQCFYPSPSTQKDKALENAFGRMEGIQLTGFGQSDD